MKRSFSPKIWLTTALITVVGLSFVSGASAMRNARDPFNQGYGSADPSAVVSNSSSGFNWTFVAVVGGMILTAAVIAYAVTQVGRQRSVATAH